MVTPWRKGSVLLFLMRINAIRRCQLIETSATDKCVSSSNERDVGDVYSETLSMPKNASKTAERSMSLLNGDSVRSRKSLMRRSMCQVTGGLVGLLNLLPWERRMALRTYSSLSICSIRLLNPLILLRYWIPHKYTLIDLREILLERDTQKFSSTFSESGRGLEPNLAQNSRY